MDNNDRTSVGLHPLMSPEQLTIGTVIVYHLLPEDNPADPEYPWRGRILSTTLLDLDVIWVESLEEGFEGQMEYVLLEQMVGKMRADEPGSACDQDGL